ncbi:MAG: TraR/DksA family transcriptional regulator [Bdellovibrionaceae bacterium]|nr:TraR/DksA family transcriptional regulator [Pseudobdellovibrionaceae bacterium]MDW8191000.1 TraR/DksA family transcriptional regulator [Pseudobdellovibrionaceae bacterium]
MKKMFVDQMRLRLLEDKMRILSKIEEFKKLHLQHHESGQDEAEMTSHDVNTNLAIELQERNRLALMRIERALEKIEKNIYGVCESCGADIGSKRLMAQPLARLCINCMKDLEERPQLH